MSPGDYVPCYLLLIMLFLYILISVPRWWCPLRPTFTLTSPMSRTLRSGAFTGPHDALILAPPSTLCRTTCTGIVDGLRMEARWPTRYFALGGVPHSPSPRIYAVSTLSYVDSTSDFKSKGSQKHFLSQKFLKANQFFDTTCVYKILWPTQDVLQIFIIMNKFITSEFQIKVTANKILFQYCT